MSDKKTAIITGASGGIGAGLVEAFLREVYNVVATSLGTSRSLTASPGVVDTPLHEGVPKESLTTRQPLKTMTQVKDIVDAVLYLARAGQVTGEVIHVDGGSHAGRW